MLGEGWYLMSSSEVERALLHPDEESSLGVKLSTEEALAYRNAGNLPDGEGRSLRLVLHVVQHTPEAVTKRRLDFEEDFLDAPTWRRSGSKPVNVIPLIEQGGTAADEWWNDSEVAALEREWQATGTIAGVRVPGDYRSFVHKTVLALKASGKEITAGSIADSIARWTEPGDAERIRRALLEANR